MPAAKKAAVSKAEVRTVSEDTTGGVPGISPELEDARKALLEAEAETGLKDAKGALLVDTEPEIGIDPVLVEARTAALKAEQDRKTY